MDERKAKLLLKWPREIMSDDRVSIFAKRFPTIEKLREFYEDTRGLAWPEFHGESPWGFSGMAAHLVFDGEANVPDHFHEPWRSDLVRAIEELENRYILAGERADIFRGVLFRAISKGLLTTSGGDQPMRYAPFKFDGLCFRDVHFIAHVRPKGDNPLAGDVVLYRTHSLPTQTNAVATFPVRDVIKSPSSKPDLSELRRILLFDDGKGGYQWGDTRGDEGNYGAETLATLVLLGYVNRTGGDVRNELGGSWPEVEITSKGVLTLMRVDALSKKQNEMYDAAVAGKPRFYAHFKAALTNGGPDAWDTSSDGAECGRFAVQEEDVALFPELANVDSVLVWDDGIEIHQAEISAKSDCCRSR